jgi:hypothetical protein
MEVQGMLASFDNSAKFSETCFVRLNNNEVINDWIYHKEYG